MLYECNKFITVEIVKILIENPERSIIFLTVLKTLKMYFLLLSIQPSGIGHIVKYLGHKKALFNKNQSNNLKILLQIFLKK